MTHGGATPEEHGTAEVGYVRRQLDGGRPVTVLLVDVRRSRSGSAGGPTGSDL